MTDEEEKNTETEDNSSQVDATWDANDEDSYDPASDRVLEQDEIDSLLGYADSGEEEVEGIRAIVNSALVAYERLPMLEVVFDRLVRMLSTSLRNFTSDNVEVSLESITSVRFGDYLDSIPLPAMLGVFKAEEWDNYGLMVIDSPMIYSIVDVLLGGRRGAGATRVEGRPYTTIERNLVERLLTVILSDLSGAFDPLSPVTFRYERVETNPRFATIAREANAIVLVKLRFDMEGRGGQVDIILPYATLEPIRELLLQMFMGEKFGRDSIWENHLADELWKTHVKVNVVLGQVTIPLSKAMKWKVGDNLPLGVVAGSDVAVFCGDEQMFTARAGRKGSRLSIQIKERS